MYKHDEFPSSFIIFNYHIGEEELPYLKSSIPYSESGWGKAQDMV